MYTASGPLIPLKKEVSWLLEKWLTKLPCCRWSSMSSSWSPASVGSWVTSLRSGMYTSCVPLMGCLRINSLYIYLFPPHAHVWTFPLPHVKPSPPSLGQSRPLELHPLLHSGLRLPSFSGLVTSEDVNSSVHLQDSSAQPHNWSPSPLCRSSPAWLAFLYYIWSICPEGFF